MAKVLVVTSGKGGVGKTTTTAAVGAALAQNGKKVVVVDFDVGLRNLDLVMGAERRVVFDLINVVQGVAKLPQALIRDKRLENLWLLPASQTRDKDALTEEGVARVLSDLREKFDWIICDSPVRSGQSIVFPDGDVTVVGSVASGAEIVAGGSIHVYGTLRGRAMAGINGNASARIYCHRMEAELLAIDGYYQTAEEIPESLRDRPVQALLDGNVMRITPLS